MNMKDMIMDGTVIKFRDGRLAVAISSINPKEDYYTYVFYGLNELPSSYVNRNGIIKLDAYDNCLNTKEGGVLSKYDIMAIANGPFCSKAIIRIIFGFGSEKDILWNWKREEIKEVTMEAVEEKFGCKVKIVKEKN